MNTDTYEEVPRNLKVFGELDLKDEWSETPDFTAWKENEYKTFNWEQSMKDIEKKYKLPPQNKRKQLVDDSFIEDRIDRLKKVYKTYEGEKCWVKFDIEPPKDNSNSPFVNFHEPEN